MEKIILKFACDDFPRFIILDADTSADIAELSGMGYEDAVLLLEGNNVPYELWDRPITVPPFLL